VTGRVEALSPASRSQLGEMIDVVKAKDQRARCGDRERRARLRHAPWLEGPAARDLGPVRRTARSREALRPRSQGAARLCDQDGRRVADPAARAALRLRRRADGVDHRDRPVDRQERRRVGLDELEDALQEQSQRSSTSSPGRRRGRSAGVARDRGDARRARAEVRRGPRRRQGARPRVAMYFQRTFCSRRSISSGSNT